MVFVRLFAVVGIFSPPVCSDLRADVCMYI